MNKRLSWSRIKDFFQGEWVELVDFEWEWGKSNPRWAVVRYHASDRNQLMRKIQMSGERSDSIVLFIGPTESVIQLEALVANL